MLRTFLQSMDIVSLHPSNIDLRAINRAVSLLARGELVAYPTDSHPAVAADALDASAVNNLCRLKNVNPARQTLTLVCCSIAQAARYARIDNRAFQLIRRNTPGPFTFILPPASSLPKVYKGRRQVGIRIPDNPVALSLAEALDRPLLSGSIDTADPSDFDNCVAMVLTDASADAEVMNTAVVDLTDSSDPRIIREGPVSLSE